MFPSTDTARIERTEQVTGQNLSEGANTDNPYYGLEDTSKDCSTVKVTENPYYSGIEM